MELPIRLISCYEGSIWLSWKLDTTVYMSKKGMHMCVVYLIKRVNRTSLSIG
jgi:hypothetical protein